LFAALFTLLLGWQAALTYIPLAVTNIYHGSDPGTAVGIVVGVGGLAVMVVGPVVGALADRYGRWRMLFIGALVAAALLPLPMFARSVPALAASWGAANAMLSSIFALSFTVISEATTGEMRARVMSFAYLPAYLSNMTGAAIGSFIAGYSVWWIFPIGALLTMIGVGVLWWASRLIRPKLVTT
jgi:MFS family permease